MGVEHFGISECMGGGGKISMPPVVGVRIFSGTTQLSISDLKWQEKKVHINIHIYIYHIFVKK